MLDNHLTYLLRSRLQFGFILFYTVFIFTYYGLLISNLHYGTDIQELLLCDNLFLKIIICQFFIVLISIPLCVCRCFSQLEDQLKQGVVSNSFIDLLRAITLFCSVCMILILFCMFISLPILVHAQSLYGIDFRELWLIYTQIIFLYIFVISLTIFFNFYLKNSLSAMIVSYFIILFLGLGYLFIALTATSIFNDQLINYHLLFLILLRPFYKIIMLISDANPSGIFRLSYLSYLFTYLTLSVIFIFLSIKKARSFIR
ncbi:hypothetical protein S225a_18930 [Candidatus Brocadiaceae bacterium S225]|uniref:Uncharacterized protein n=1 Tax=Candidatus Scalindua brodae TaxID=237368 RepID=A0A0B0EQ56_9BACT|nr:MAG: hypothetical protein SCABRO_00236 [Candidatus Scalindua brodae]TWU32129.1 hypothetical protein S225a_18930 [Candidatus Brocadiaceae bacterium S225]